MLKRRFSQPELVLIGITVLWGTTFLIIRIAMEAGGNPLGFVGTRFLIAGMILLAIFHRALRAATRWDWIAGLSVGVLIALGAGLQTAGLQSVTASQAAFITALYVPLVPIMQWIFLRQRPHLMSWVGAAIAFSGLVFLAGGPSAIAMGLSLGVVLTLLSSFAFAGEIILISAIASRVDTQRVVVIQVLAGGLFALFGAFAMGETPPLSNPTWLIGAAVLGAMSALIQFAMNWAQRFVSPTRATIIYAGEPVWGGIIGRIAGERLPPIALLGAGLIVFSVLISELKLTRKKEPRG